MANRIVGLDIGSWAVKAVTLQTQRQLEVIDYREILLTEIDGIASEHTTDGTVDAPPPLPSGQDPVVDQHGPEQQASTGGDGEVFPDLDGEPGGDWADEAEGQPPPAEAADPPWADGGEEPLQPESEGAPEEIPRWAQAVARLEAQGVFEGATHVITSFPEGRAVTLHLEVPFERESDVAEILPHLLMDELPISPDEVVHDFVVIPGKGPDLWEALIGIVERDEMAQFLASCRWAQLDPAIVGVPELMLRYAGDQGVPTGVASYGIIDFGHQFTRLLIMSEGKPVVAHATARGGAQVTEALAENFQIPAERARELKHREGIVGSAARGGDAQVRKIRGTIEESFRPVVRDLRRTFQSAYAKYDVAVDAVYICGGGSRLVGLEDFLHGEFEVPVHHLELDNGVMWSVGAAQRERTPEAAVALGSALQKPLDDGDKKLIDFRQGEFVYRGKSSYLRTQLVRFGAVAAVLFVLLAGVLIMQRYERSSQLQAMERAVAEQTSDLFGEPVMTLAEVESRLHGEDASSRAFVPQMSAYELLYRIIERTSEDIPLELSRIEVDTDRGLVQVVGTTDSPHSVELLADEIEGLECLTDVRKDRVNVRGEEVQFELQISSGCS